MAIALLILVTIGVAECAAHVPLAAMTSRFMGVIPRAIRAIGNDKVSDHWKERALLKLARLSLTSSACLGGTIFGLVALFVGGSYVLSLVAPPLWDLALSIEGVIVASVVALLYLVVRSHASSRLQRR